MSFESSNLTGAVHFFSDCAFESWPQHERNECNARKQGPGTTERRVELRVLLVHQVLLFAERADLWPVVQNRYFQFEGW